MNLENRPGDTYAAANINGTLVPANFTVGTRQYNSESVTDNGVGDYELIFPTGRQYSIFNVVFTATLVGSAPGMVTLEKSSPISVRVRTFNSAGVATDREVMVIGVYTAIGSP